MLYLGFLLNAPLAQIIAGQLSKRVYSLVHFSGCSKSDVQFQAPSGAFLSLFQEVYA